MRAIDFVNRLVADGAVSHPRCKSVRVHRIDGGAPLQAFPTSSRASADSVMIERLFDAGRAAGTEWIARHFEAVGHRSTVDIRRDYLDDTRLDVPTAPPAGLRSVGRGFRPWLARLLRQQRP